MKSADCKSQVDGSRATPGAANVTRVGKRGLCAALRWSRPRLDRWLESDPAFPVVQRGGRTSAWQFDLDTVLRYLGHHADASSAAAPEPKTPTRSVEHAGELSQRRRRYGAEAELLEDKLRESRSRLVEASEARAVVTLLMDSICRRLDVIPGSVASQLSLAPDAAKQIALMVEELKQTAWRDLRSLVYVPTPVPR